MKNVTIIHYNACTRMVGHALCNLGLSDLKKWTNEFPYIIQKTFRI